MPDVQLQSLLDGEGAERSPHVLPYGNALPAEETLEGGLAREALDERA